MSAATILLNDLNVKKLFLHFLIFANLISFKLSHTLKKKKQTRKLSLVCYMSVTCRRKRVYKYINEYITNCTFRCAPSKDTDHPAHLQSDQSLMAALLWRIWCSFKQAVKTSIALDRCFFQSKYWYFSYFSTKTYVVGISTTYVFVEK